METYKYKALTPNGLETNGVVQARDEYDAAARIRQTCPVILKITKVSKAENVLTRQLGTGRVNIKALSVACSQIAITLKAGIQVAKALSLIGEQTSDKVLHKALLDTAEDVSGGASLTDSLQRNCPSLPPTFIETIRAGEQSGNIERSFDEMAKYYERAYKTTAKIKSALSYPIFVVVIAIIVLIIVMVLVIPSLSNTFADLGGELPIMTQILISISNFFSKYWIFIVMVILAVVVVWKLFVRTEKGHVVQGKLQLSMPVIGKINRLNGAAEFANTMTMLLRSGITVDRASAITGRTLSNYTLQKEIDGIVGKLEEGHPFGECMRGCENFPKTLREMCAIGEETGELDSTLDVIGQFYANEADTATKDALAKLEPTMLVFLAFFAGFIVISIYLPMFTMYNLM